MIDQRPAEVIAHLLDLRRATGLDADLVAGTADLHLERAAKCPANDVLRGGRAFRQQQATIDLVERRQAGQRLQLVVLETVVAAHFRILGMAQRNIEFQVEAAVAARLHVGGEMIELFTQRALFKEAQELAGRPLGQAAYQQHFLVRLEIGDAHLDAGQRGPQDAPLAGCDLHAGIESHVRRDAVDGRPARGIVDPGIGRPGGNDELATLAVAEGKILQLALEHQSPVVTLAGHDTPANPRPRFGIDHMRHVAPDRRRLGPLDLGREINLAGAIAGVAINPLGRTGGIRAGKLELVEANIGASRAVLPVGTGLQRSQRDVRFRKNSGQRQAGAAGIHDQVAAFLAQVDHAGQALRPREIAAGFQPQVVKSRFQAIAAQGIAIQRPAGFQFGDTPLRPVLFEQFAAFRIERHVGSQFGQHRQIEEGRAGGAVNLGTRRVLAPLQIEIGGCDTHAIQGQQLDLVP